MPYNHPEFVRIYRAFDMGFMPDPAYCLWIAHLGKRYIAFKEKTWYKTVASDIAKDILEESNGMRIITTYCDPSIDIHTGADILTIKGIFEQNGVPMENSINNREHFAHAVHTALAEEVEPGIPRLQIYSKGCPYLIKAIPQQRYNPKHPMAMADQKNDHPVVTLAYFLMSHSSEERHAIPSLTKAKKWMRPKPGERHVLGADGVRSDTSAY